MSKPYYYAHAGALNRELKRLIPAQTLKGLHQKSAWRHFAIALRQLFLLVLLPTVIFYADSVLIWAPAVVLQGFVIFSFSVLLHEVVHKAVFERDRPRVLAVMGYLYGTISGLACHQFKRWHLDHHLELGSQSADPKRAYLSPKVNARWYKMLYCTPVLFPIYFRAARKATAHYPPALKAAVKRDRLIVFAFHISVLIGMMLLGPAFALKAYIIPVFFIFPVAFTINRLGQHYVIDPDEVAAWSTLMRPNHVWNFLFLYSSYHLEHHYFPGVPFYRLKALQRQLEPFYREKGIQAYHYRQLLKAWFIDNHTPHTRLLAD